MNFLYSVEIIDSNCFIFSTSDLGRFIIEMDREQRNLSQGMGYLKAISWFIDEDRNECVNLSIDYCSVTLEDAIEYLIYGYENEYLARLVYKATATIKDEWREIPNLIKEMYDYLHPLYSHEFN